MFAHNDYKVSFGQQMKKKTFKMPVMSTLGHLEVSRIFKMFLS
jgi:hypothetical protein